MKKLAMLLCFILSMVLISAHQYDNTSCKTLLPVTRHASQWRILLNNGDSTIGGVLSSEETSEDQDDDDGDEENEEAPLHLVPAMERSPFKIETSSLKYRRNRIMTIKIEGSKLNGLLLQARQRFPSSLSTRPTFIGNFVDVPEGFQTMDCNPGESLYESNTVFNTNQGYKTSVKLNWKAPGDNFDSIEFLATIIRGKYYWTHVKSMPIFFNEFPPSFSQCGKERSCHQYVKSPSQCKDGFCNDYVLMSEVTDKFVKFYIGGKIESENGFIGIAFTDDKEKLSGLDLTVCRKKDKRTIDVANYKVNKSIGHLKRQFDYTTSAMYDIDGDYSWCSFRHPINSPDHTNAADLSKNLYYMLIRGHTDPITHNPYLPNEDELYREIRKWKTAETFNTIDYYGGSNIASLSRALIIVIFIANVVRLMQ